MADNDTDLSPLEVIGPDERLTVRSALKATLDRELAAMASTPSGETGSGPTPQHMASPGRCTPADARAGPITALNHELVPTRRTPTP